MDLVKLCLQPKIILRMTIAKSEATCFQHLTSSTNQAKHQETLTRQEDISQQTGESDYVSMICEFLYGMYPTTLCQLNSSRTFSCYTGEVLLCEVSEQTLLSSQTMTTT